MSTGTHARVFDPLWFLARQWQVGEFQAEDAGSPVQARVRATSAMLSRCHLGELKHDTQMRAPPYDPMAAPLEVHVERRRMRPADANDARMLTLAVEAGLQFLRMLDLQPLSKSYRAVLIQRFALQALPAPPADADPIDEATSRFMQTMTARAPDARRLADAFRNGGAAQVVLEAPLKIAVADRAEVQQTALAWLAWYDALVNEPAPVPDAPGDAWQPSRLEYAVSVAARLSDRPEDEFALTAAEFDDGRLDWSSFDRNLEVRMGTDGDRKLSSVVETTVPAPVGFRGAPAARFWEMEDARIAYGLLPVGPTDLAQLMVIEYAGSYGNDWFVVPLTLPVGSLTRVESLVVTDTFGVRSLLRPIGDPALPPPHWSMWQLGCLRRAGEAPIDSPQTNLFFLPPSLGRVIEGGVLEDVLLMRDEMANLAWAIERSTESPVEQAVQRIENDAGTSPPTGRADGSLHYVLSSTVPANWIPLLPVQLAAEDGKIVQRLRRGAVLQPDGSRKIHPAQGTVLNAGTQLLLYDEEVPREGAHVTRARRMARWTDGSTWVWTSFRRQVGRGEGSSALRFDQVEGEGEGDGDA
ncbi:hypothetical protein QTH97_31650 [Variovorax sp. J22R24]|uniref:hypothetical protein n=1 Tax=Variovorax gracilis TaxID=3053502 RepID=UPI0025778F91|nr:hypothetical protein [Variovorax sp. J22R24]MDM0109518.1 hypothetical protein [Variovorax sp. J22R24]